MTAVDGSVAWTYTYDTDGLRLSRSDGTTTYNYVYLGSQLKRMTVGSTEIYFAYDSDGSPMSMVYNGITYYYVKNLQGDVVGIVDKTGVQVVAYSYDAWGNLLGISGAKASTIGAKNPLRYRGYVYDTETNLYYLQSRYYNPEIGRFLNADSYTSTGSLLGNNMFAYCNNNPVNYIDPTGYFHYVYQGGDDYEFMYGLARSSGGGGGGSGGWNPGVNIPHFKTNAAGKDFTTLYYSRGLSNGTQTTSFLSGGIDAFSFGSDGVTIFAMDVSLLSFDCDVGYANFTVADLGNVDINCGRGADGFYATAMISAVESSVEFNIGNTTVSFGAYIGGLGWVAELNSFSDWKIGFVDLVGGYISFSKSK